MEGYLYGSPIELLQGVTPIAHNGIRWYDEIMILKNKVKRGPQQFVFFS